METKPNHAGKTVVFILIAIIVISAIVLFHLANKPETTPADIPDEYTNAEPETQAEVIYDSAEYKTEKDDVSFDNHNSNLYLTQYFERIVLTDENEKFRNINALIKEKSDAFLAEAKENEAFTTDEKFITNMQYVNHHTANVTKNSDGIISIKMTATKFMGGVYNMDTYGLNYDLNTGEELSLTTVLDMSKNDALEYLREESKKQIGEGFYENAAEIIDNYKFENFSYYLQDGAIYLCYPTYTLAPGAAGSVVMRIENPADSDN